MRDYVPLKTGIGFLYMGDRENAPCDHEHQSVSGRAARKTLQLNILS